MRVLNPGKDKLVLHRGTTAGVLTEVRKGDIEIGHLPEVSHVEREEPGMPMHLQDLYHRSVNNLELADHNKVKELLNEFDRPKRMLNTMYS